MKKYSTIIPLILFTVLLLPVSSCMHMMMMGGHDDHNEHQATSIIKETTNGDATLSVSIPPMVDGKEGSVTITPRTKSSMPESVGIHYMISKSSDTAGSSGHDHSGSSAVKGEFKTIHQNIVMLKGTSAIFFTPTSAGNFVLTVEIEKTPNVDSSFSIEVNFMVHEQNSSGMMGMGGMWDYPVLGVIVMGSIMVGMWMFRGGIF